MCARADVHAQIMCVCVFVYIYGGAGGVSVRGCDTVCVLWSSPSCVSLTAVILILLVKSHNFVHQQKQKQQGKNKLQLQPLQTEEVKTESTHKRSYPGVM